MTRDAFNAHTCQVINLEIAEAGQSQDEPTSAMQIINCIRYWKNRPQIPVRLRVVLTGGEVLECRLRDELSIWELVKRRGVIANVKELIPADIKDRVLR